MLRGLGIFTWLIVRLAGTAAIVASWFVAVRAAVRVHIRSGLLVELKEWDQGVVTALVCGDSPTNPAAYAIIERGVSECKAHRRRLA